MFHCLYTHGGEPRLNSFYLADDGETVLSYTIVDDRDYGGTLYTAIKGWNLYTREQHTGECQTRLLDERVFTDRVYIYKLNRVELASSNS